MQENWYTSSWNLLALRLQTGCICSQSGSVQGSETKAIALDSLGTPHPWPCARRTLSDALGYWSKLRFLCHWNSLEGWGAALPKSWSWQPVPMNKGPLAFALISRTSPGGSLGIISQCLLADICHSKGDCLNTICPLKLFANWAVLWDFLMISATCKCFFREIFSRKPD